MQDPIRVFLLDHHEVARRGLTDLLDAGPDIQVVGDADTAEHALTRGPAPHPDVAVLDVRLPDGDGITVCRELRDRIPEVACPMLTSFDDEEALLDTITAGASGYVLEQIKGSDLVSAVRTVASGRSMLDPATTARLMQRDILVGDGPTNREIGKKLYLSEKAVKNHNSRMLSTLGVQRRVQAAVLVSHLEPPGAAVREDHKDH
ncbi:DNA-binding response regulator [Streptomyces alanosinicus]|uniref:DNA-binding response regulator n=1 Tax=Streptomyces alanosinicus TaxID=68171 RepID=A0A918YS73_9ACTN|nr:DNA-binding response regulator [Streptomyces alanosinicus]